MRGFLGLIAAARSIAPRLLVLLPVAAALLLSGCASSGGTEGGGLFGGVGKPDTFLHSDDYRDGEEIVGAVLTDEDYALMVEDIERHGADFNWGWVKAVDGKPAAPKTLAFDVASFSRVRVLPVANKSMKVAPEISQAVHDALAQAMGLLDLEVVESGPADLELEVAVVDYTSASTFIWVATLDPFLELEGRLRDVDSGETLFLFRHQEHGATPSTAAGDTAGQIASFLR